MATISQIQKGFIRFVDDYIAGAYSGFDKIFVSGTAVLIAKNMNNIVREYCHDPKIKLLGIYHEESDSVDIDALYDAYIRPIGDEKVAFPLPSNGFVNLGTLRIGRSEADALVRYIKEA